MENQLARFEKIAERLVEGSLSRLFAGELRPQEIIMALARALEDHAEGQLAPDHYRIFLPPAALVSLLEAEPGLASLLANKVLALARQAELDLCCPPTVELVPQTDDAQASPIVEASISRQQEEQTKTFNAGHVRQQLNQQPDGSIYLIIEGQRYIPLTRPVYTLGRRLDCDVVLSDPRVSRQHAQLRWRFGRYVLYDLGSSSGTSVNGHPVAESVLEPGDVFSLAGVDIIYGKETMGDRPLSEGDTTKALPRRTPPAAPPDQP